MCPRRYLDYFISLIIMLLALSSSVRPQSDEAQPFLGLPNLNNVQTMEHSTAVVPQDNSTDATGTDPNTEEPFNVNSVKTPMPEKSTDTTISSPAATAATSQPSSSIGTSSSSTTLSTKSAKTTREKSTAVVTELTTTQEGTAGPEATNPQNTVELPTTMPTVRLDSSTNSKTDSSTGTTKAGITNTNTYTSIQPLDNSMQTSSTTSKRPVTMTSQSGSVTSQAHAASEGNSTDVTGEPTPSKITGNEPEDGDHFWPVATALTIAIPAVIVFSVTITVLYRRRMAKPRNSLAMYGNEYENM